MEIESQRSEVIRHGCLRADGVNPLIHLSQFDPSAVLITVRRETVKIQGALIRACLLSSKCSYKINSSFEPIKKKRRKILSFGVWGENAGICWHPYIFIPTCCIFSFLERVWRSQILAGVVNLCMQAKETKTESRLFLSGIMKKKKSDQEKGRSMSVSPGGVSDGLTQTVEVNSIPLRPLKLEEKDTDRKRVRRDWEEKLGKINSMRLCVWQWCATVQQQPWQYLFRNLPHFLLQAIMHGALTSHTLAFCCDMMCITRFYAAFLGYSQAIPPPFAIAC